MVSLVHFGISSELIDISGDSETHLTKSDSELSATIDGICEDEWIIRAIWLEENGLFAKCKEIYEKLYEYTDKKEYLFKEVSSSIFSKSDISTSLEKLKKWSSEHPENLVGRRLLMALYLDQRSFNEAKEIGSYLVDHSDDVSDLELAANPYLLLGEYDKGIELLNKLYLKTKNEEIIIKIAAIENQYLKNRKKAIQILETHRRVADASEDIYKHLIELYVKEKNLDQILETYRALYDKFPEKIYLNKIIEIYLYTNNIKELISYLEGNHGDDHVLYDLYKQEKRYSEALKMSNQFYLEDKDPKWLAEKAILIYESSKNKSNKKILNKMISLFDEAIKKGVNDSLYLNYYGYTLIDQDIDIDRGLKIVGEALQQQPDNGIYLDSQAWGYYKNFECLKAYNIMKIVIEKEGLEEPEIKEHWEKIQECQKPVLVGSIMKERK